MTTPQILAEYLAEVVQQWFNKGRAVYNPQNKPEDTLPVIYGLNNGGHSGWLKGELLAEDGTHIGTQVCSDEGCMLCDLGILTGSRPDLHEQFKAHYPEGYRMEFVRYCHVIDHVKLNESFSKFSTDSHP